MEMSRVFSPHSARFRGVVIIPDPPSSVWVLGARLMMRYQAYSVLMSLVMQCNMSASVRNCTASYRVCVLGLGENRERA